MEIEEEIKLLSDYFDVPEENVKFIDDNGIYGYGRTYDVDGDTYAVLEDDDATEAAREDIESMIEDSGWCVNLPIENYVDEDSLFDDMHQNHMSYAEDIEQEFSGKPYANRLVRECIGRGIIDDEYLEKDSDGFLDFKEGDRFGIIDKFVEALDDQYDNSLDWYISNFGDSELGKLLENGTLDVNYDDLTEDVIVYDGRGSLLSSYDGQEHDLGEGMYAYQQ